MGTETTELKALYKGRRRHGRSRLVVVSCSYLHQGVGLKESCFRSTITTRFGVQRPARTSLQAGNTNFISTMASNHPRDDSEAMATLEDSDRPVKRMRQTPETRLGSATAKTPSNKEPEDSDEEEEEIVPEKPDLSGRASDLYLDTVRFGRFSFFRRISEVRDDV